MPLEEILLEIEINNPKQYKAALYIRISKEDGNEKESQSITNQRYMLRAFAGENKLIIYDEYIDDGYSGTSFDRPAFNRLLKDLKSKKVNMIITKDMSRLGRDYIQIGYYMEKYFPENKIRYISLLDGIDTGVESASNDVTPFKAIMNDMYAKDISKKIKSVKHDKQKKGLFIGGKAPYGYKISTTEKNVIIIDEVAKKVVEKIFHMALSGISCRQIAMKLNESDIPPPAVYANINLSAKGPYSGKWSSERIAFMLKNQVYLGNMVQGRVKKISYKSKKCLKIPEEHWAIVPNTHEPIVDKETFDKVQTLINSRKYTRNRIYDYPLKGIIYCHECSYPLAVIKRKLSGNKETLYFICRTYQRFTKLRKCTCHTVREEYITKAVIEQIQKICMKYIDKENFGRIAEQVCLNKNFISNNKDEIVSVKSQINCINSQLDKTYTDKLTGLIEESDFVRMYEKIKKKRSHLESKLNNLENDPFVDLKKEPLYYEELIKKFLNSVEYNRELIVSLVEKIELSKNKEIFIYFKFKELNKLHS